jgi:hypothetical protein
MFKRTLLATVVAVGLLGGSAFAGSRWVITSTHQIKPSVLKQLRGQTGPQGAIGAPGASGPAGPAGIATIQDVDASTSYCAFGSSCDVESVTATCPGSAIAVGGAANASTIDTGVSTFVGGNIYIGEVNNESDSSGTLSVTAVCASGSGVQFSLRRANERSNSAAVSAAGQELSELRNETP